MYKSARVYNELDLTEEMDRLAAKGATKIQWGFIKYSVRIDYFLITYWMEK